MLALRAPRALREISSAGRCLRRSLASAAASQSGAGSSVFGFGYAGHGQLGQGNREPQDLPTRIDALQGKRVTALSGGHFHACAIAEGGRGVYAWGRAAEGQLDGEARVDDALVPERVRVDAAREGEAPPLFVQISCGGSYNAAVAEDGSVWIWGSMKRGQAGAPGPALQRPARVPGLPPAAKVSCGWGHVLCLTRSGEVWSWGWDAHGQTGRGAGPPPTSTSEWKGPPLLPGPVLSGDLRGHRVSDVAAGLDHSLALGVDGTVFSWGDNQFGQLGLGHARSVGEPRAVASVRVPVSSIATGWAHSALITADGAVLACGWNSDGQVVCGRIHTLARTGARRPAPPRHATPRPAPLLTLERRLAY
eukprot:tig00020660_g12566.t1